MATDKKRNFSDWVTVGSICLFVIGIVISVGASKRPQEEEGLRPPLSDTNYLCSLQSYRRHILDDVIEEVQEHGGDRFEEEAARKRILSIPYSSLEANRQADLAFTRRTYQEANDHRDLCPSP
ncbi:MAG: hypothetical protein JSS87_15195 [Acidobacteria bacterium]|nr:hypothetical protein [Acidobacteriota bacterium]